MSSPLVLALRREQHLVILASFHTLEDCVLNDTYFCYLILALLSLFFPIFVALHF